MDIALIEPEIPGNTGSVGRVCVGTGTTLHLVGRLGFSIDDKAVRRAGLDYWKDVDLIVHEDVDRWFEEVKGRRLHLFSSHGTVRYDKVQYHGDDILVFGGETRGLPRWLHEQFADEMVYLPINPAIRSLNLANAVTVALFEALRQAGFSGIRSNT